MTRRLVAVVIAATLLLAATGAAYLLRPPVQVGSRADPEVTIECAATTGIGPGACLAWGDELLEAGPPSFTFEMDDLVRLEVERPWFGLSSACEAAYFLSRYPDDAVWSEEVACAHAQ